MQVVIATENASKIKDRDSRLPISMHQTDGSPTTPLMEGICRIWSNLSRHFVIFPSSPINASACS